MTVHGVPACRPVTPKSPQHLVRTRLTVVVIAVALVVTSVAGVAIIKRAADDGAAPAPATPSPTADSASPATSAEMTVPDARWVDISPSISFDFADFGGMNYGAQTIALSPSDPSTVYLGTCYQGIWRTTDAGETWEQVNSGRNGKNLETGRNWTLAVDPNDADTLYTVAGFGFEQGLWKSVDGGVNWSQMLPEDVAAQTSPDVYSVAIDPDDSGHLLLGFHSGWAGGPASGVVESRDSGRTWIIHDPEPSWGSGHYAFFVTGTTWLVTTQDDGVWRTTDSGNSWVRVSKTPMQHGANQLYRTAEGVLFLGGLHTLLTSSDEGESWTAVGPWSQDGYNAIIGDGQFLYAQAANTGMNTLADDPPYVISPEHDGQRWTPYNDGAQIFANGPMAMAFDPEARIIYSSNWGAGVWKLQL